MSVTLESPSRALIPPQPCIPAALRGANPTGHEPSRLRWLPRHACHVPHAIPPAFTRTAHLTCVRARTDTNTYTCLAQPRVNHSSISLQSHLCPTQEMNSFAFELPRLPPFRRPKSESARRPKKLR